MNASIEKLKLAFQKDLTEYRPIPFWSWNGDLDEKILVKQIEEMKAVGLGGFIMHARLGLTTEYLGGKWFSCIEACLKKAKELNMRAWIYDENGWPSGFVGGKLLERKEFLAQYLTYEISSNFDESAFCIYEKKDGNFLLINGEKSGVSEYHCIYLHTSPSNTDILNPEVTEAFISQTHEEYYKRFSESFGKELVGFFTDEPQYYRWATPYSRIAEKEYVKKYGEDEVRKNLIYLFLQDEKGYPFRSRWYAFLNELYVNNFYKKLYDWCEAHNCQLTGHSLEEVNVVGQMSGGAGVMTTYEYEHVPAIDWLGNRCAPEFPSRQVASVASQLGKKQVLTETFGCAGNDVTPRELKSIGESQFFNGVNLLCHHLLPYTIAGQGKHDHPPVFSKHGNWWEEFGAFNEYFTRLGYIVANTQDEYDVLIIHPLKSEYLDYIRQCDFESVKQQELSFCELLSTLRRHGVQYHLADESLLEKYGSIEDGLLQIGQCKYGKILVPAMKNIAKTTLELLNAYKGQLCVLETPSYVDGVKTTITLAANATLKEFFSNSKIRYSCQDGNVGITSRSGELGEFLFIKNYSSTDVGKAQLYGVANAYKALDLEDCSLRNISDEIVLPAHGSMILIKAQDAITEVRKWQTEDITDRFQIADISDNYLVLDCASFGYDGIIYSDQMPLVKISERLLREDYKGTVFIRQLFYINEKMPLKLILENGRFYFVKVNGENVELKESAFDFNFREADIGEAVKTGVNILEYAVDYYQHEGVRFALFDPLATESLRNCLYYDTHIENAYIKGDFVLDDKLSVCKSCFPNVTDNLPQTGYPFFKGELVMIGEYNYDGLGERILSLEGMYLVASVYVNGKKTDFALQSEKEITKYLNTGKNELKIIVRSSIRNLFGPHHFKGERSPMFTWPTMFTMRGEWGDGDSESYTHEYNHVPFGIKAIKILK